jgi:hypothetical protein
MPRPYNDFPEKMPPIFRTNGNKIRPAAVIMPFYTGYFSAVIFVIFCGHGFGLLI